MCEYPENGMKMLFSCIHKFEPFEHEHCLRAKHESSCQKTELSIRFWHRHPHQEPLPELPLQVPIPWMHAILPPAGCYSNGSGRIHILHTPMVIFFSVLKAVYEMVILIACFCCAFHYAFNMVLNIVQIPSDADSIIFYLDFYERYFIFAAVFAVNTGWQFWLCTRMGRIHCRQIFL